MGVLSALGLRPATEVEAAEARAAAAEQTASWTATDAEMLREAMVDLELALDDEGWSKLAVGSVDEFSREGIRKAAAVCRTMAVANPLIKRGLAIRTGYVWGQGVQIAARATGDRERNAQEQNVNEVVQLFLDDKGNQSTFSGSQARARNERALGTDGNIFFALFTSPLTGHVRVRTLPFDQIQKKVTNPEDGAEVRYYRREWTRNVVLPDGAAVTQRAVTYYPDINYRPARRPRTYGGFEIAWDAPVCHVKVNDLDGWAFGIGDAYTAISWARAYRDFLSDWATLVKALSQFAWRASSKGSRSQQLRAKLARTPSAPASPAAPNPANPTGVGGTFVSSPDATLEAIPKTGATIDSESGRPLASMVAAGLGVPVTMLLGDPGVTGARATAETLDRPTEDEMSLRRGVWDEAHQAILHHVIRSAVIAPQGPLKGRVTVDPYSGEEVVELAGDTDPTVEVTWPPLDEIPMDVMVKAIVDAAGLNVLQTEDLARLILSALRVPDVDDVLERMRDEDGNIVDRTASAADAAVAAFRAGRDPAEVV